MGSSVSPEIDPPNPEVPGHSKVLGGTVAVDIAKTRGSKHGLGFCYVPRPLANFDIVSPPAFQQPEHRHLCLPDPGLRIKSAAKEEGAIGVDFACLLIPSVSVGAGCVDVKHEASAWL